MRDPARDRGEEPHAEDGQGRQRTGGGVAEAEVGGDRVEQRRDARDGDPQVGGDRDERQGHDPDGRGSGRIVVASDVVEHPQRLDVSRTRSARSLVAVGREERRLLGGPALPVRPVGLAVAVDARAHPQRAVGVDEDAHGGIRPGRLHAGAAPSTTRKRRRGTSRRARPLVADPAPHAGMPPARLRRERLQHLRGEQPGGLGQAVPARVEVVHVHHGDGADRLERELDPAGQRRLARAARTVEGDDDDVAAAGLGRGERERPPRRRRGPRAVPGSRSSHMGATLPSRAGLA